MSKIEICFFTARILQNQRMLCCGVVKNFIYSNGDLDHGPNDSKINKGLPLPQGNHVA